MKLPGNMRSATFRASAHATRRGERGIMLTEAVLYVALLALVLALALGAFYRAFENNRNLTRNADDILAALRAGERWRADVRRATAEPVVAPGASATNAVLRLSRGPEAVTYTLRDGVMVRRGAGETNDVPVLTGIARSEFVRDPRQHVVVWRWELELTGRQKVARVRPLFTFEAVAPAEAK